ncbi:MAG TPA: hypothetical protein VK530_21580, partial [Candidatus Acidoferrum sp.]|nr:hypothetical protein [Candidatus Acidoferrum sp.]
GFGLGSDQHSILFLRAPGLVPALFAAAKVFHHGTRGAKQMANDVFRLMSCGCPLDFMKWSTDFQRPFNK